MTPGGKPDRRVIQWSSADPAVATVGTTDGIVTAVSIGTTTVTAAVGALRGTATVIVDPDSVYATVTGATASTEYTSDEWSAFQATGAPNAEGCNDDPRAWANLEFDGVDWLELTYAQPVRPSEIRIHEVWGVGSIVKVEVRMQAGRHGHCLHGAARRATDLSAHAHDPGHGRSGNGLDGPGNRRPAIHIRLE